MSFTSTTIVSLLLASATTIHAFFGIDEIAAYSSADSCAQSCAFYYYDFYWIEFSCNRPDIAGCLCNVGSDRSSTVNAAMANCVSTAPCKSADVATVSGIFSAYCSVNGHDQALELATLSSEGVTVATSAPTSNPSAGSTATSSNPQNTGNPSSTSTSGGSDGSLNMSSLSQSDKIAIICAAVGAAVTIMVAIPTWSYYRKKRAAAEISSAIRGADLGDSYQPPMTHVVPQQVNHFPNYPGSIQHPQNSQLYYQNGWSGQSWK